MMEPRKWDAVSAAMVAEGASEAADYDEWVSAFQYLIDTGIAWNLQGWFGRTAQGLIENGECHA